MSDPYAGIAKPVASNPYAGIAKPVAPPAATPMTIAAKPVSLPDQAKRSLGLSARALVQGAASVPGIVYDPLANLTAMATGAPSYMTARDLAGNVMTAMGAPKPENALERIVGSATEGVAGAGTGLGLASQIGKAKGVVDAANPFAQNAMAQLFGGAGAGTGQQVAAEMGAGPIGQLTGALAGGLAGGSVAARVGVPKVSKAPTVEALKNESQQLYQKVDNSGVRIAPVDFDKIVARATNMVQGRVGSIDFNPNVRRVLDVLDSERSPTPMTFSKLERMRREINNEARQSTNPTEQAILLEIENEIDDFVMNFKPSQFAGNAANAEDVASALKSARNLYARQAKAQTIDGLVDRAKTAAESRGTEVSKTLRQEFLTLTQNERRMKRFSPDEQLIIRKIAKGGPLQHLLGLVATLSPGTTRGTIATAAGAVTGGAPLAAGVIAAGSGARLGNNALALQQAKQMSEAIRRGGPVAKPPNSTLPLVLAPNILQQGQKNDPRNRGLKY